jgi:hypothetical protein
MSCEIQNVISIEELEIQMAEARGGKAKIDKEYVNNTVHLNHIFEYSYDYTGFLDDISYIIKEGKRRDAEGTGYRSKHKVIIQ